MEPPSSVNVDDMVDRLQAHFVMGEERGEELARYQGAWPRDVEQPG